MKQGMQSLLERFLAFSREDHAACLVRMEIQLITIQALGREDEDSFAVRRHRGQDAIFWNTRSTLWNHCACNIKRIRAREWALPGCVWNVFSVEQIIPNDNALRHPRPFLKRINGASVVRIQPTDMEVQLVLTTCQCGLNDNADLSPGKGGSDPMLRRAKGKFPVRVPRPSLNILHTDGRLKRPDQKTTILAAGPWVSGGIQMPGVVLQPKWVFEGSVELEYALIILAVPTFAGRGVEKLVDATGRKFGIVGVFTAIAGKRDGVFVFITGDQVEVAGIRASSQGVRVGAKSGPRMGSGA